jgi:hypothetical protein
MERASIAMSTSSFSPDVSQGHRGQGREAVEKQSNAERECSQRLDDSADVCSERGPHDQVPAMSEEGESSSKSIAPGGFRRDQKKTDRAHPKVEIQSSQTPDQELRSDKETIAQDLSKVNPLPGTVSAVGMPGQASQLDSASMEDKTSFPTQAGGPVKAIRRSRDIARVAAEPIALSTLPLSSAKSDKYETRPEAIVSDAGPSLQTTISARDKQAAEATPSTSEDAPKGPQRHRQRAAPAEGGRRTSLAGYYSRAVARRPLRIAKALVKKANSMFRILTGRKKEGTSIQDFRLHKVLGEHASH